MTDIHNPIFTNESGRESGLDRTVMALWYFAHRDATAEADNLLAKRGLNRTHFRAMFFINLSPGITLNELIPILQLSHQGASRVIADLIRGEFVEQLTGTLDRRQRHLRLTRKGQRLEKEVVACQTAMLARSEEKCGKTIARAFRQFLVGLLSPEDYATLVGMLEADPTGEVGQEAFLRPLRQVSPARRRSAS